MINNSSDKSIVNNFFKVGLLQAFISVLSIAFGIIFVFTRTQTENYYLQYLVIGSITAIFGFIGLLGSFHKYKELPEGNIYSYPAFGMYSTPCLVIFPITFFILMLNFAMDDETASIGTLILLMLTFFVAFAFTILAIPYKRTNGLIICEDKIHVIKPFKQYTILISEIDHMKVGDISGKWEAIGRDGKVLFKFSRSWFDYMYIVRYFDSKQLYK